MSECAVFIPGRPGPPGGPLARYRPTQAVQAVGAYLREFTEPGDLVVDLFCQDSNAIRAAIATGRRALGISANPLLLVVAELGVSQRDPDTLNAAFTRLTDSLKGGIPLYRHIDALYRSACPSCGSLGTAEWFAWDRDGNYPFWKRVRCAQCEETQEGATDSADVDSAHSIPARALAYHYALDRVTSSSHPARERAAELVELYTPRNLSALMDLSLRLEGLDAKDAPKLVLTAALLDCFDAGSSLDSYGEVRRRPRTLRVPNRYFERNVWMCFEEGFLRHLAEGSPYPVIPGGTGEGRERLAPKAAEVADWVAGGGAGYALSSLSAREVGKIVPAGSVALVFADPPRPDAVFWALSALWAGWLWDSPSARALRPFLRRRRFEWDWHWRVLGTALGAVGPLLTPQGHLITLFSERDDELLESVCLASSSAGYHLVGWGHTSEAGYRLVWRWEPTELPQETDVAMLEREVMSATEQATVNTLRERGEPTPQSLLYTSAYTSLVEQGLLARAAMIREEGPSVFSFAASAVHRAFQTAPIVQLTEPKDVREPLWWLMDSDQPTGPGMDVGGSALADRVELAAWELLARQPTWNAEDLVNAVYARLSGPLTPDLALVLFCIDSYSVQEGTKVRLRPEDDPQRRAAEPQALRESLEKLGHRLGFAVSEAEEWDVRWQEDGQDAYVFIISVTASLGSCLLPGRTADASAQRCLVLPGGRAQLVTFKVQRDPRLALAVKVYEWQFIKFRHLRRLTEENELDRYALKTVLGLDPIVEREAAQIPLF